MKNIYILLLLSLLGNVYQNYAMETTESHDLEDQYLATIEKAIADKTALTYRSEDGGTYLHEVAAKGNVAAMERLLKEGFDINAVDNEGRTPLYCAVKGNQKNAVTWLLEQNNLKVSRANTRKITPLHCALMLYHHEIMELILKHPGFKLYDEIEIIIIDKDKRTRSRISGTLIDSNVLQRACGATTGYNPYENLDRETKYQEAINALKTLKIALSYGIPVVSTEREYIERDFDAILATQENWSVSYLVSYNNLSSVLYVLPENRVAVAAIFDEKKRKNEFKKIERREDLPGSHVRFLPLLRPDHLVLSQINGNVSIARRHFRRVTFCQ